MIPKPYSYCLLSKLCKLLRTEDLTTYDYSSYSYLLLRILASTSFSGVTHHDQHKLVQGVKLFSKIILYSMMLFLASSFHVVDVECQQIERAQLSFQRSKASRLVERRQHASYILSVSFD